LFSLAAVRRERDGDERLNKFDAQSVPMIAVGHSIQQIILLSHRLIMCFSPMLLVELDLATNINLEHSFIDWMSQPPFFNFNSP
jgi:hypothetical protein